MQLASFILALAGLCLIAEVWVIAKTKDSPAKLPVIIGLGTACFVLAQIAKEVAANAN